MASYRFGSNLSYLDYLQAEEFAGDITRASRGAGRSVSLSVSAQTRAIIASQEALGQQHIAVHRETSRDQIDAIQDASREQISAMRDLAREQMDVIRDTSDRQIEAQREMTREITGALESGFERLDYRLDTIATGIAELEATFEWGFSQMLSELGHMNDQLSTLVKIAKTPVQTVAFNHFEIARDAFRRGLYIESLEELERAISGDHTSPGYKLEWRFHHLRAIIRLGFAGCEKKLVSLPEAEEAFLAAARYAKADYPLDAGCAFLSAGWAAYCQGKFKEALSHTQQAMGLHPGLGEAFFQAAKLLMVLEQPDRALSHLGKAIDRDVFYSLRAAGDGDFQKHEPALRRFLETMRQEKSREISKQIAAIIRSSEGAKHPPEFNEFLSRLQERAARVESMPLMDLMLLSKELGAPKTLEMLKTERARQETFRDLAASITSGLEGLREEGFSDAMRETKKNLLRVAAEGDSWPLDELRRCVHPDTWRALQEERERQQGALGISAQVDEFLRNAPGTTMPEGFAALVRELEKAKTESSKWSFEETATFEQKLKDLSGRLWIWIRPPQKVELRPAGFLRKAVYGEREIHAFGPLNGPEVCTMEFLRVRAGRFLSSNDVYLNCSEPLVETRIEKDFMLGRIPVTGRQWNALTQFSLAGDPFSPGDYRIAGGEYSGNDARLDYAANGIRGDAAEFFVKRLNLLAGENLYRLPTRAEWLYAYRCGQDAIKDYYRNDKEATLFRATCGPIHQGPPETAEPNAWGFHFQGLRAMEWCQPVGATGTGSVCGGHWGTRFSKAPCLNYGCFLHIQESDRAYQVRLVRML